VADRELLEAKYTAPSGKEFTFLWEVSEKETVLKTGVFTFPDKDGAHVQHQGRGPVSFPMTCIFNGENNIEMADNFEEALGEKETAELQHPVYGIKKVIPTGNIKRKEDCINSINESYVTITFTENITDEPGKLEKVTADELEEDFDEFSEASAADFAESISAENIGEQLQIQSVLEEQANMVNDNLSGIISPPSITDVTGAATKNDKLAEFTTSTKELKDNIKNMFYSSEGTVQKTINIARITLNLMKLPSRIIIDINEKIKGYTQLITQIVKQFKNDPYGTNNIKNSFASTRLVLTASIASLSSGAALSIAESAAANTSGVGYSYSSGTGVLSRETAVLAAVELNHLLETIQIFEDSKIEQNVFIDSNASSYLLLIELVYNSIQLILNMSFSLPMRRTITIDRDRNFIELCAELYGTVDSYYLDRFISENDFNIDELEIIPMGREVSYYVKSA
jgi:prophage DNA circulation protein